MTHRSTIARRVLFGATLLAFGALVVRLAGTEPTFTSLAVTIAASAAVVAGLCVHVRGQSRHWRFAWLLLGASLIAGTVGTTRHVIAGSSPHYPGLVDWTSAGCAVTAAFAIGLLLSTRARGRGVDAMLEAFVVVGSVSYVAAVSAVAGGAGQLDALVSLAPVAAWLVAACMLLRLLFLTRGQLAGYRYLGVAFVLIAASKAMLAGVHLDGASVPRTTVLALMLSAYILWAIGSGHTSVGRAFEPVPPRARSFGRHEVALCIVGTAVPPLTLAIFAANSQLRPQSGLLIASAFGPVVLATYLVRQVRTRAHAEFRAQHDALTGLPNRALFEDRVKVAIAQSRRSDTSVALMFLDLDRFKSINDSLGHAVGNELLQAVASRLRETVRASDTVARMGGDEFSVLLSGIDDSSDAAVTARKIVARLAEPFNVGGRTLHTSTSIGIALCPTDGEDVDTLLKHADSAMYRAKARGRDGYEFFTPDLSVRAQARLYVESGLRGALERNALELYYQPQVDIRSGRIIGLEALTRWRHRRIGVVTPDVFVPIAEETGLILPLGEWAIEAACADMRRWRDAGIAPRKVGVNVSARQLAQPGFVDDLAKNLARYEVPPEHLVLEITESLFIRNLARGIGTLEECRKLGVSCSIDDFGTGFSGLSYLADMPIDTLKIDQSFVARIQRVEDEAPIIDAIIGLARALELDVVAEGVETSVQAQFLANIGCTDMQGFLFSRPRPLDHVERLLTLDDKGGVNWLGIPSAESLAPPLDLGAAEQNNATMLLSALCLGKPVDGREEEIENLLATLVPAPAKTAARSGLRATSMRVAVGSFAGLVPITTGLAAAHALPAPIERAVAATLSSAGVSIPSVDHATDVAASPGSPGHSVTRHGDGHPQAALSSQTSNVEDHDVALVAHIAVPQHPDASHDTNANHGDPTPETNNGSNDDGNGNGNGSTPSNRGNGNANGHSNNGAAHGSSGDHNATHGNSQGNTNANGNSNSGGNSHQTHGSKSNSSASSNGNDAKGKSKK